MFKTYFRFPICQTYFHANERPEKLSSFRLRSWTQEMSFRCLVFLLAYMVFVSCQLSDTSDVRKTYFVSTTMLHVKAGIWAKIFEYFVAWNKSLIMLTNSKLVGTFWVIFYWKDLRVNSSLILLHYQNVQFEVM